MWLKHLTPVTQYHKLVTRLNKDYIYSTVQYFILYAVFKFVCHPYNSEDLCHKPNIQSTLEKFSLAKRVTLEEKKNTDTICQNAEVQAFIN